MLPLSALQLAACKCLNTHLAYRPPSRRGLTPAQAFAAPERVAELVGRVREALGGALPAAAAKMRLYLPSPATRAILLKPIKSNVAEAHGQVGGWGC